MSTQPEIQSEIDTLTLTVNANLVKMNEAIAATPEEKEDIMAWFLERMYDEIYVS